MPKVLALTLLTAMAACVIGRPARPSVGESAQGPSAQPVSGSPIVPQQAPGVDESPPIGTKAGMIWVRGYHHWDGVRYVWEAGRWQKIPPAPRDRSTN